MTTGGPRSTRRATPPPRPPVPVLLLAGIAIAFFALPFLGLLWRVPWGSAWSLLTDPASLTALRLSIECSVLAAVLSLVLGVPLSWVLARHSFPGRRLLRALCLLSLVLPPVVAGVALFAAFGRRGMLGGPLSDWFGLHLPFTTAGVVMAQTFVAMPFLVLTVEAALRGVDHRPEDAARTLGASSWTVLRRVTLPAIRPALIAGTVLAWARALGEFGATITFAGNLPGTTQTAPLAVYRALETDPDQALVLSVVLITISFAVLLGLRDRWLAPPSAVGP
ncbi:MAG: molybdate ABC transporter permease subunit [Acidobacteria bacterium]|nr:molybdate ABC transporter permease subunit [Acidobacteriota bacterium]